MWMGTCDKCGAKVDNAVKGKPISLINDELARKGWLAQNDSGRMYCPKCYPEWKTLFASVKPKGPNVVALMEEYEAGKVSAKKGMGI